MEIRIDKDKAWKRLLLGTSISATIWAIIFGIAGYYVAGWAQWNQLLWGSIAAAAIVLCHVWSAGTNKLWLNALEYHAEPHQLTETGGIITKYRNQARLQVINDIQINQDGLLDRMFGFWQLTVDYGFSSEGYTFTFQYLTEAQALELQKYIKPSGRGIHVR